MIAHDLYKHVVTVSFKMACGYQHEFLKPPAKLKKYECPDCLCVTREPHLTDCCGQHFCQACINRIITSENPIVPCCQARKFNVMIDKKRRRKVLKLKVRCTMKGCDWSVKLGKHKRHLDTHCQYVDVKCSNRCGEIFQRRHLAKHLLELCPKRPSTCEYCGFKATYEDMNKHYPDCIKYPVPCPNKCEVGTVERGNLEQHMSECPLQLVECHLGCSERIKREGLPQHVGVCPKRPFTCKYCQFKATYEQVCNNHYPKCVKYPVPCPNKCEIGTIEQGNLEQHMSECPLQVVECDYSYAGCNEKITRKDLAMHKEVGKDDHLLLLSDFSRRARIKQDRLDEANSIVSRAEFKVVDFSKYKRSRSNKRVEGLVLYTHLMGAKIKIYTYFRRLSYDREEDVSYDREVKVEFWQFPGEFDKMVKWPVQCTVTVKLLDQYGRRHMTESAEDIVLNKPNKCEYLRDLLTVNFTKLKSSPRFLRNDSLKFNVAVKLT